MRHEYLLRALVSYGLYRLSCVVRQTQASSATTCAAAAPTRCARRRGSAAPPATFPADQLDELVWADLCALLTDPAQIARALDRAHGGAWLPQKLQARQTAIRQAPGPARPPVATAAGRLPGRGHRPARTSALAGGAGPPLRHLDGPAAPARRLPLTSAWSCRRWQTTSRDSARPIRTGLATATFSQRR